MRLARRQDNYWELRSGEQSQRANPDKFWIPLLKDRQNLRTGQAVRLIFDIEADDDGNLVVLSERMWVIVSECVGDVYVGILTNQPASFDRSEDFYLCLGAEIPFAAEHVIDLADPPEDYVKWQLGQPPARRWPRE